MTNYVLPAECRLYHLGRDLTFSVEFTYNFGILHLDGQQGGIAFLEASPNAGSGATLSPRIWTRGGNAITSETDKKFNNGTALYLDGASWIDTPTVQPAANGLHLYAFSLFSMAFHFKPTAGDGTLRYLMGVAAPNGSNAICRVWLDTADKLNVFLGNAAGVGNTAISTTTFPSATAGWHHVGIGVSASGPGLRSVDDPVVTPAAYFGGSLNLYIDGVNQSGKQLPSTGEPTLGPSNPNKFAIGRLGEQPGNYFTGYIDEWYMYPNGFTNYNMNRTAPIGDFPIVNFRKGKLFFANTGYYSVAPLGWSPPNLGANLVSWHDASDANTVIITGSGVSQWTDKSVNGNHATQSDDIKRPPSSSGKITLAALKSLNFPNCPGSFDYIFVGKTDAGSLRRMALWSWGDGVNFYSPLTIESDDKLGVMSTTAFGQAGTQTWPGGTEALVYGTVQPGTVSTLAKNGAALAGTALTLWTSPLKQIGWDGQGEYNYLGYDWHFGDIYEFIMLPFGQTLDVRQKLEGYIAHKWGLAARLPSDHPYKNPTATLASTHRLFAAQGTYGINSGVGLDQYTTVLLHFDTDFSDSAKLSRIWSGTTLPVLQSTYKFGPASAYFNGFSWLDTPTSTDFDVGSNDFTVDCWFNVTGGDGTFRFLFGSSTLAGGGIGRTYDICMMNDNTVRFLFCTSVTNYALFSLAPLLAGSGWHHVEANRQGGTLRLFLDGVLQTSAGFAGVPKDTVPGSKFAIGRLGEGAASYFIGYMDEIRFSKGIARHTSNFTPPTIPYAAPSGIAILDYNHNLPADAEKYTLVLDNVDRYTKTLLHMENNWLDTTKLRTWTPSPANFSSGTVKFGTFSGYFSGSGYVWTPPSIDFNVGTGDWTVDCWFYVNAGDGTARYLFGTSDTTGSASSRCIDLWISSQNKAGGTVTFNSPDYYVANLTGTTNITAGAPANPGWHHLELSNQNGMLRLFLNGVLEASFNMVAVYPVARPVNNNTKNYSIGRLGERAGNYHNGYVDELRFSKGVARHTSNFTPATTAYSYGGNPDAVIFLSGKSLLASQGSYSIVTPSTILKRLVYSSAAVNGVYSIIGNIQILRYNHSPYSANGVYSITGSAASFRLGKAVLAAKGNYSTIGQVALLKAIRVSLMSNENYTITGRDAALRSVRKVYAANSVYSTAGKTVTFYRNYVVTVPSGIYTMTGKSGTNILPAIRTNYVLSGKAAITKIGYRILSNKGTFSLSGQNVASRQTYALTSAKGNYLLTSTVTLNATHKLYALNSFYNLAGNTVVLRSQRKSFFAQANYQINGRLVVLKAGHILYPTVRSFTLVPNPAVLRINHKLYPEKDDYTVTGRPVVLRFNHRIINAVGTYAVNGKALAYRAERTVYLAKGTYSQTGKANTFLRKLVLTATWGSYTTIGNSVSFYRRLRILTTFAAYNLSKQANAFQAKRTIYLAQGSYTQTGKVAGLKFSHRVLANNGSYSAVGTATLRVAHKLYAAKGNYIFSGQAVKLTYPPRLYSDRGNFTLTGKVATLTKRKRLLVVSQPFTLTGNLVVLRSKRFAYANHRVFSLTGRVSTIRRGYHTVVDYGILKLIGKPVTFLRKYASKVSQGTYGINKPNTLLTKGSAFSGDYGVVGTPVTFIRSHKRIKMGSILEDGTPVAAVKQTIPLKRHAKLIDY
jgi:hypothetical protein